MSCHKVQNSFHYYFHSLGGETNSKVTDGCVERERERERERALLLNLGSSCSLAVMATLNK